MAVASIEKMIFDDAELISIYYGSDVEESETEQLLSVLNERFPDVDVEMQYGGQPVYAYIASVE